MCCGRIQIAKFVNGRIDDRRKRFPVCFLNRVDPEMQIRRLVVM